MTERYGDALLVLAAELDLSHVTLLENAARRALEAGPARLLLDMSALTFLRSSILGTIVRIQVTASRLAPASPLGS